MKTNIKYYKSDNDYATLYILQENEACHVTRVSKKDERPRMHTASAEQIRENFSLHEITKKEYDFNFKLAKQDMTFQ